MAAGLARAGMRPVLALYSTFMNRGFDQLIMDVALHREPVTVVLDRAGITGDDGASHNGVWDLSIAAMVPGLRTAAPRHGEQRAAEKIEGGLRRGKCVQSRERGSHRHPPPHSDHIPGAELRRKQESGRVKYIEHHCGIPAELFVKGVLRRPQPPAKGKRR